jgi:hypothetical protein
MSSVDWIVGSSQELDAARQLMYGDTAGDPRDELGIAPLRDALSNAFFPGITTLQTRAKYFLLVPRMYREIERKRPSRVPTRDRIRTIEGRLLERFKGTGEHGVIGSRFWKVPDTPASEIYWTGLYTWRIRLFSNPRTFYHRVLDSGSPVMVEALSDDSADSALSAWDCPPDTDGLLDTRTMNLTSAHAEFLRDRALTIRDRSDRPLLKDLIAGDSILPDVPFWDLAAARAAHLAQLAADAERLSIAMQGAMLVYNARCAELAGIAVDNWGDRLQSWSLEYPPAYWGDWDLAAFWQRVARLDEGWAERRTGPFVKAWVAELRQHKPGTNALRLIATREKAVKPGRARLEGKDALGNWNPSTGVGAGQLVFRWNQARTIINDVHTGLQSA